MIEEESYSGDTNAIVIRVDLERALVSKCLTPRERHCIALYYFACLNLDEVAKILGITSQGAHRRLKKAIPQISEHMDGEPVKVSQALRVVAPGGPSVLERWLRAVTYNEPNWFKVPEGVWLQLRAIFPKDESEYNAKEVYYNWRSERSLREVTYKEIPRPEIYPTFDNRGSRSGGDGCKQKIVQNS